MPLLRPRRLALWLAGAVATGAGLFVACSSEPSPTPVDAGADAVAADVAPPPEAAPPTDSATDARPDSGCVVERGAAVDAGDEADAAVEAGDDGGDPLGDAASFTLTQAMAGFPEHDGGVLTARITTELGEIVCHLDEAAAPISVANFVGLARGTRPFLKSGQWTVGRFYDGLLWHRVIPDFVIQGGDPRGTGTGGPGYALPNENHAPQDLGVLSMAASNPTPEDFLPSGSQFYIVVGDGPKADYNVFGACSVETAKAVAAVERRANDKPKVAVHMSVSIERCPR